MNRKIQNSYQNSLKVDQENIRLDIFLHQHFDSISRTKIKDYIIKNPLPSSEKIAAQKLERLEANIEFVLNIKNNFNEEAIEKVLKEN